MLILYWEVALGSKNKRYGILNELQAVMVPEYLLCCRMLVGMEREEEEGIKAGTGLSSGRPAPFVVSTERDAFEAAAWNHSPKGKEWPS